MIPKYDTLLNKFKDNSIQEDSLAPVGKNNGYLSLVNGVLWYFTGGNRYKIKAILNNPTGGDNYYASLWFLFANVNT